MINRGLPLLSFAVWSVLLSGAILHAAQPGDVIISEFLANADGNDDNMEWFELYNTTDAPINTNGWRIVDNDNDTHIIANGAPLNVPPKGHLVLGQSADPQLNGGIVVDYAYGLAGQTLANEDDEIILLQGSVVIHSIGYGTYDPTPFNILSVVPLAPEGGVALGMGEDYCDGPVIFWRKQFSLSNPDENNTGTPGADNDSVRLCADDVAPPQLVGADLGRRDLAILRFDEPVARAPAENEANYLLDGGIGQPATASVLDDDRYVVLTFPAQLVSGTNYTLSVDNLEDLSGNAIDQPAFAQLQFVTPIISITEIIYDNCGDDIEWVELRNTTGIALDLSNWYLSDDDAYPATGEGSVLVPPGTIIGPGEYLVVNLWNHPFFSANWRMPSNVRVVTTFPQVLGSLSNSADNLALFDAASGGALVDGSLSADFPDLCGDGESLEKIDELFPWGAPDAAAFNFRAARVPDRIETALNLEGERLSNHATPGRPNDSIFIRNAAQSWSLYQ